MWTVKLKNDLLSVSERRKRATATVVYIHRIITVGRLWTIINYVQIIGLLFEVISRNSDLHNNPSLHVTIFIQLMQKMSFHHDV